MGLGKPLDDSRPSRVDNIEVQDVQSDTSETESPGDVNAEVQYSRTKMNKKKREEKRIRRMMEELDLDRIRPKKNASYRKFRRFHYASELINMVDKDDVCFDFSDMVPNTVSVLGRLLTSKDNMQIWREFTEKDENEQRALLCPRRKQRHSYGSFYNLDDFDRINSDDILQDLHFPTMDVNFSQIDPKLKSMLYEKQNLWDFLDSMEDDLRCFFSTDPAGMYICILDNSLKRACVHALSQYLSLSSKSITDVETGSRIMEVSNINSQFTPSVHKLLFVLSWKK